MSTTGRPLGRGRGLTAARIAAAAMEVVDEEGLALLTMRRIAARLDCAVSSLYSHVGGRDDVLDLVVDHLAEQIALPAAGSAGWREQVEDVCTQLFATLTDHADIAGATLGTVPTGTAALRVTDHLVGQFLEAGLDPEAALGAADLVLRHTATAAYETGVWTRRLRSGQDPLASRRQALDAMPADQLPHLWPLRHRMLPSDGPDRDPRARFRYGLHTILDGIEQRLATTPAEPGRR